ncbi:hypothetical protein MASR2M15_02800 [Anaerolineales bacterium]
MNDPFSSYIRGEFSVSYMSGPMDGHTVYFREPEAGDQIVVTMGRRESCDIPLDYDNQSSRIHARLGCASKAITSSGEDHKQNFILTFWLEDNGSRNGTFIEKTEEAIDGRVTLRPGTFFRIGRTWLRLDAPLSF